MSGAIETLVKRPGSARLLQKLCNTANNVGEVIVERNAHCKAKPRSRGKTKIIVDLNKDSPFYTKPSNLPKKRVPQPTKHHAAKTEKSDIESQIELMTNRINLLKAEQDRIEKSTQAVQREIRLVNQRRVENFKDILPTKL